MLNTRENTKTYRTPLAPLRGEGPGVRGLSAVSQNVPFLLVQSLQYKRVSAGSRSQLDIQEFETQSVRRTSLRDLSPTKNHFYN